MTDPTTEALNAAKREFWERMSFTDADTIDQMNFSRILDTIETQARAAGRKEERKRIRAALPDEWHPWPDSEDDTISHEADGYNDYRRSVLAILDAPRATAVAADRVDDGLGASQPAEEETHLFVDSRFGPNRCRDCDHPREWHPQSGPAPDDEADRLLVALVAWLDGGPYTHVEQMAAARAYITRKGLA